MPCDVIDGFLSRINLYQGVRTDDLKRPRQGVTGGFLPCFQDFLPPHQLLNIPRASMFIANVYFGQAVRFANGFLPKQLHFFRGTKQNDRYDSKRSDRFD